MKTVTVRINFSGLPWRDGAKAHESCPTWEEVSELVTATVDEENDYKIVECTHKLTRADEFRIKLEAKDTKKKRK